MLISAVYRGFLITQLLKIIPACNAEDYGFNPWREDLEKIAATPVFLHKS